jgi:hypothetical protein
MSGERRRSTDTAASRRRAQRTLIVAVAIAAAVIVFGFAVGIGVGLLSDRTEDNCQRIHQLVVTLDQLIASGREQSKAYEREGTITRAQLERALRENDKSRAKLGEADCPPRARTP